MLIGSVCVDLGFFRLVGSILLFIFMFYCFNRFFFVNIFFLFIWTVLFFFLLIFFKLIRFFFVRVDNGFKFLFVLDFELDFRLRLFIFFCIFVLGF